MARGEDISAILDPPDLDLQEFEHIHHYARTGKVPWRRMTPLEHFDHTRRKISATAGATITKNIQVTRRGFENGLKSRFERELSWASVRALMKETPDASAQRLFSPRQKTVFSGGVLFSAAAFAIAPLGTLISINWLIAIYFLTVIFFRIYLAITALRLPPGAAPSSRKMTKAKLPVITVLLPLYDEAAALKLLSAAIDKLDYPSEKIDVKLLLEADDDGTIEEARRLGLHLKYDMIVLPPSQPRTKPKACNHALYLARGDLIVIYDAEDMPEADQLLKAAAVFADSKNNNDNRVACVQARLNYYNAEENWLTNGIMAQIAEKTNCGELKAA